MLDSIRYLKGRYQNTGHIGITGLDALYSVTHTFVTDSDLPFYVTDRNNVRVRIQKSTSLAVKPRTIVIGTQYTFNQTNVHEVILYLEASIRECMQTSQVVQQILESLKKDMTPYNSMQYHANGTVTANLYYTIELEKFNGSEAYYCSECDYLITTASEGSFIPHPYSPDGVTLTRLRDEHYPEAATAVFVEIVQNENLFSPRYMYVADKVVKITPTKDYEREPGVYVTTVNTRTVDKKTGDVSYKAERNFYTIEEAEEKIGLSANQEDATRAGNISERIRVRQQEMELEVVESKRKLAELTATHETQRRAQQEELDRLNHVIATERLQRNDEYEERKARRNEEFEERKNNRSDYYDVRSHERKDTTDFWKFLATAAVTGLTVYTAVTKSKS